MLLNIYSVRDNNGDFKGLFNDINDELAKRNFIMAFAADSMMNAFAQDFDLYKLGTFNSETAEIVGLLPVKVLDGVSAKAMATDIEV